MAWTKEQELAINETGKNIIVSAGAGSGKTAVLTERVITKLNKGSNIDRLLILTFTNAAASEMKDRIRRSIKKNNLKEELNKLDSAYITTFDSFALSVVKKYHMEIGIPKNVNIMDNSIQVLKTNELLSEIFNIKYNDDKFKKLIGDFCTKDDNYIKDVCKSLFKKIDLIIDKKEYLDNYVNIHYSEDYINKSINEYIKLLIHKVSDINELYKDLECLVDNKYLEKYNLIPLLNSKDYDSIKSSLYLVGSPRVNKDCSPDYKIYKESINEIIKELKDLTRFENIESIKNSILSTKEYIEAFIDIKKEFDSRFLEYKKNTNLYTFNDIALMAIDVVKNNDYIREELTNSFDEIMLDEYQDTSIIQETFINLISNNNVYMVGDIKQSIYRFRNANPYIFRNKYDNYSNNNGGFKIDLLKNFRSRKEVLSNINLIFNNIMDNDIGDAEYKETHQMNYGNISYEVDNNTSQNYNMDILTYNSKDYEDYSKDEIEAFTIFSDILDKINNKYLVVDKLTNKLRECKYSDFSIIMDRGSVFSLYKKISEYMGVPIIEIKNEKLSAGDDLLVISNLIKLIVKVNLKEYDDEFKYLFTSISRSYLYRTSDEELFNIIYKDIFNSELFKLLSSIKIDELSNLDLINIIIDKFDLYNKLLTINNIKETMLKIDYLKNLCISLSNIGYTVIDLASYLKDMIDEEAIEYTVNDDNSNSVKLLNIHKSKGLEYSICYFSGLYKKKNNEEEKSRFLIDNDFNIIVPFINNGVNDTIYKELYLNNENIKSISERIRLLYVALTRAKEKMMFLLPLEKEKEEFNNLVPKRVRLKYNSMSDMLESILPLLSSYIKKIDFSKVKLTKDYDNIKDYNYKKNIIKVNEVIDKRSINLDYEIINESKYSKVSNKLINIDEYNNMINGTKLHYEFLCSDFKNSSNKYVKALVSKLDMNYINIYKEYEFIYECDNEFKRGVIDLMLEYTNKIVIIDYKMNNIKDDNYIKQLNGYKSYISSLSNKEVIIYLYSIIGDKLEII